MTTPFDVREMPAPIAPAILQRLAEVETATIGHFRAHGFMASRIAPLLPGLRIAGTAVTVQTVGIDNMPLLIALDGLRPGDVLVIDRSGEDRHACLGAVMSKAIAQAGAVAVVMDGRACDLGDIRAQGMPLWCTGASPILCRRLSLGGGVNVPVSCGGVAVMPGDAILADESGVLVAAPHELEALIEEGLRRQAREAVVLERMARGETLTAIADLPRMADYLGAPRLS